MAKMKDPYELRDAIIRQAENGDTEGIMVLCKSKNTPPGSHVFVGLDVLARAIVKAQEAGE